MSIYKFWMRAVACAALLLPLLASADALIKPLPMPDLSGRDPAQAKQLAADRAEFEKTRAGLVGPPLAQAYADMAVIYARAGLKDVAAIALYDATQADPRDARWFYLRGVLARDLKRDAEARADFESALALDKVYAPIRYRLSDTLVDLGDLDAAERVLGTALHDYPDQAVAYAMLGQLQLRKKNFGEAAANLARALKIEPQATQLYRPLAEAYAQLGNKQAAQDALAKAGDGAPTLADPLALGLLGKTAGGPATLAHARELAGAGRISEARNALAQILHAHPDDVEALLFQARLEAPVGDNLVAAAAADQALKLAPENGTALLTRGIVYEYAGDEDRAYDYYQRALRADPKLAAARLRLGNIEMRRGRYGPAADAYRQLVTQQPGDATAHARLAAAQVAAGKCGQALADISAAQERNSRDGDLMQIFVRLASTCAQAKGEERDMALDYAQALYKQRPDAGDSTALALALAAHGKFKEAQQFQAEAIFEAVRSGDQAAAARYRATQASFAAGKMPDRPWPADDAYFKPPRLAPVGAAPAKGKPKS